MKRIAGVILMAGIFASLFGCTGGTMDGGGMVNANPTPVLADYAGVWVTEDATVKLSVEEDMASLYYREDLSRAPQLVAAVQVECGSDGALTAVDGDRIGFYSSIVKDGRLLYATDAVTGEADALAHSRSDFRPESLAEYDGVWYTRDSGVRMEIKNGRVSVYEMNGRGDYRLRSTGKAELRSDGALYDADGRSDVAGYSCIERKGRLLHATVPVTDASGVEDVFARAGRSDDFPPLPNYAKSAADVSDRAIVSFELSASCFDRAKTDGFVFRELDGLADAADLRIRLHRLRTTGERRVTIAAHDADYGALLDLDYAVTDALEQSLAELLLSDAVLGCNPTRDSSDMARPTVRFALTAKFASGEDVSITTAYGVPIGQAALDIAALLLGGGE